MLLRGDTLALSLQESLSLREIALTMLCDLRRGPFPALDWFGPRRDRRRWYDAPSPNIPLWSRALRPDRDQCRCDGAGRRRHHRDIHPGTSGDGDQSDSRPPGRVTARRKVIPSDACNLGQNGTSRTPQDPLVLGSAIWRGVRSYCGNSRISRNRGIGFQDHRHRPLGHPSAARIRPEFASSCR